MAAKKKAPTPKKDPFQKAAEQLVSKHPDRFEFACGAEWLIAKHADQNLVFKGSPAGVDAFLASSSLCLKQLDLQETTDLGDILQFIYTTVAALDPAPPPAHLGGNGKDFEESLMTEAGRLEKQGILTMGRYGTMVSLVDNEWRPIPSYPDFEGARRNGRQFIIEAKVCTQPSFRVRNDNLKFKQVRHMMTRSRFSVSCYLVVHFNARLGRTFYDPAFTVAIPVKPAELGGWPVWDEYARCKDKNFEFPPITREQALQLGELVKWHIPARSTNPRPDLLGIVDTH
jgi:hypothetical protein